MSDINLCWFHCGRCGSLFQSAPGESEERVCAHCGEDPCTGVVNAPSPALISAQAAAEANKALEKAAASGVRGRKKSHDHYVIISLVLGWSLVLMLIIFVVRWLSPVDSEDPVSNEVAAPLVSKEDVLLFQEAGQMCQQTLFQFLSASTPEARSQFVLSPLTTAALMMQYDSLNPIPSIDPSTLQLTHSALLNLPDGKAYEGHWATADGKIIDAVFRKEKDEWRLDWQHFSRFSDYPWALFLAGSGPDEGEFRLFARERLAEERKLKKAISVVLYAPRFGTPRETGYQSPGFFIDRDQPDGQLLDSAFKLLRSGGMAFDSKMPNINPEDMIRVRVKVRRSVGDDGNEFEITSVIAGHWLSVDAPGFEVLTEPSATMDEEDPDPYDP